jgi:hypothetical protein
MRSTSVPYPATLRKQTIEQGRRLQHRKFVER